MNYELLKNKIEQYLEKIKNEDNFNNINERQEREKFYSQYSKDKIINMDLDEFYEYIGKLWAMIIWGNKQYIIDKYIDDNGFENLKKQIAYLLYSDEKIENRWDNFKNNIKGFGPAMMSELLCYIYPNDFMIWNSTAVNAYKNLDIKGIPTHNYQLTGDKYVEMVSYAKEIQKFIKQEYNLDYNLLFVDYFFWDVLRKYEDSSNIEKVQNDNKEVSKSLHTELKEKVKDIGIWLGFDAKNEVKVGHGAIVDAVWDFSINNIGKVTYVFEVQTGGSIDSLIMNLLKAAKYKNVQGIIAVSDEKQLEKIKNESDEIFKDSTLKIQLWDQNDVLDVYDKLQSVNESVNKILHIDDSLGN